MGDLDWKFAEVCDDESLTSRAAARYGRYVNNVDGVEPQAFFWRRVVQLVRACAATSTPPSLHGHSGADLLAADAGTV